MESFTLDSLQKDTSFTGDLLLDSSFLLLPKGADISESMLSALKKWKFETILCDGNLSIGGEIETTEADEFLTKENPDETQQKLGEDIKKAIQDSKRSIYDTSEEARLEGVEQVYNEYMNYIENVFTHYSTHKVIDQNDLSETVQQLCIFIKENRRYILRLTQNPKKSDRNFIVVHAMRTAVLGIAIAMQLHLPLSKMIEVGITCIIHEIGMLRLPPQLYNTSKKLTAGQRTQISRHTVFGYTIVKDLNFPVTIQLGVLEHHEKENGLGYPRRLSGEKISPIAKIVSVVCTYEAISSPRSYKDERSTFDALLEMIQNREKAYDDTVLKALLYTVSLYPIGTYVYLSNRKIGVVVDSNQKNPKCPAVQMITEKQADGSDIIVQTSEELSILRILSKKEKEDILQLLRQKEEAISKVHMIEEGKDSGVREEKKQVHKAVQLKDYEKFKMKKEEPEKEEKSPAPENKSSAPAAGDSKTEEVDISFFN